jgi:hypothetical protein
MDAAPRDAVAFDAGPFDAGDVDSGMEMDGGGVFDPSTCAIDPATDVFALGMDSPARVRDVGVAGGPTGLALAWSQNVAGAEDVFFVENPESGPFGPAPITDERALLRDPVIVPNGPRWILAWYGNPDGDFDVYSKATYDPSVMPPVDPPIQRLTSHVGRDDAPVLLATPAGARVFWVESRSMDSQRVAVSRPVDVEAVATGAQVDSSPAGITTISRPAVGPLEANGFGLAWVDSSSGMPSVRMQALDSGGAPVGGVITLSTEGNADGTLDVATNASGGAVVFGALASGVRPEVHARLVDGTGNPLASERVITVSPASGRDASIARIAGGYVVAYRSLAAGTATLRLEFLTASLDPIVALDSVPVATTGGRVTVRVSGEGRMIVGWADVDVTTTTIRAARVRCE